MIWPCDMMWAMVLAGCGLWVTTPPRNVPSSQQYANHLHGLHQSVTKIMFPIVLLLAEVSNDDSNYFILFIVCKSYYVMESQVNAGLNKGTFAQERFASSSQIS